MGDNLTVAQRSQSSNQFNVKVDGNVTIQNFKGNRKLGNLEAKTVVKKGHVNNYFKWGNMPNETKERALNLSATEYGMFEAARKADKSDKKGEVLTRSDLQALKKDTALQKKLGITIRADESKGIYTLTKNGSTLYFDFD